MRDERDELLAALVSMIEHAEEGAVIAIKWWDKPRIKALIKRYHEIGPALPTRRNFRNGAATKSAHAVRIDHNHDMIVAFMEWQRSLQIYPMPGTSVGMGCYWAVFDAEHAAAINEFFANYDPALTDGAESEMMPS